MSTMDEYLKRGGLSGATLTSLASEMIKAKNKPNHPLHEITTPDERLIKIMKKQAQQKDSPLNELAKNFLLLCNITAIQQAINDAAERMKTEHTSSIDYPTEILVWAAMVAEQTRSQRAAGSKPKADALQLFIRNCVTENPNLPLNELFEKLEDIETQDTDEELFIHSINEKTIEFSGPYKTTKTAKISGLKDRLSRAKKEYRANRIAIIQ